VAGVLAEMTELLLILVVLVDLFALAASRLGSLIRIVALQGIVLGIVPLLADPEELAPRAIVLAALSLGLKAFVFPILLFRATREDAVRREVAPDVGYSLSLLIGAVLIGGSFVLGSRLPLPFPAISPLLVPVALSTALIGMFVIVSRRKAATQVLGYLVLENGIFVFGLTLAGKMPWLVEMGVLLDVFIGIFVMGIALHHIHRQFDSIDVDRLTTLRDVP